MVCLPILLVRLEISSQLSSLLSSFLSLALQLLHLPIVVILCDLGFQLSFGVPVLDLLLHGLQVLGLLGRKLKLLIIGQSFQLHHLAVVLEDREPQELSLGPLLGRLLSELLGHPVFVLEEGGLLRCLLLSSLVLLFRVTLSFNSISLTLVLA